MKNIFKIFYFIASLFIIIGVTLKISHQQGVPAMKMGIVIGIVSLIADNITKGKRIKELENIIK